MPLVCLRREILWHGTAGEKTQGIPLVTTYHYFQNDVEGSILLGSFGKKGQKCIMKLLTRINTES